MDYSNDETTGAEDRGPANSYESETGTFFAKQNEGGAFIRIENGRHSKTKVECATHSILLELGIPFQLELR